MTDNDTKKSLSLKDRGATNKNSKIIPGSKNVTIQVRRKKIINTQNVPEKKVNQAVDRSNFAALTVEESFISGNYNSKCFNVEDGFEGHEQPSGDSLNQTGWKNLGLPWE